MLYKEICRNMYVLAYSALKENHYKNLELQLLPVEMQIYQIWEKNLKLIINTVNCGRVVITVLSLPDKSWKQRKRKFRCLWR